MGTRCRGLGEIIARLTGPVVGQIVTRVQITERKSIITQIVEIGVVGCSVPVARDGVIWLDRFGRLAAGLVH